MEEMKGGRGSTCSKEVGKGLRLDDTRVGGVEEGESLLELDFLAVGERHCDGDVRVGWGEWNEEEEKRKEGKEKREERKRKKGEDEGRQRRPVFENE